MTELQIGAWLFVVTFAVLFSGIPIAFGLIIVSVGFLLCFGDISSVMTASNIFVSDLSSFALLTIPLFVLLGSAIGSSQAGKDVYESLHRWMHRLPGGLVIANLAGCGLFSALCGSSPATAAAIGKSGVPEMLARGVPARLATGAIAAGGTLGILIPPSLTFIVYGIVTHTSIARLFLAGVVPGLFLITIFAVYAWLGSRRHQRRLQRQGAQTTASHHYTLQEKCAGMLRVLPFLGIIVGVTVMMYSGVATPSEVAALAAFLALLLVVCIYRIRSLAGIWHILGDTVRESTMILTIVAAAAMYAYMMSDLYITQSVAEWMLDWGLSRWQLLLVLNVFLLMAGLFLPPVSIILMSMPVILPVLTQMDIDLIWFAVMMTINLEIGLITPPMGMNLFVIQGVAPQVALRDVILGALPFVALMLGFIALITFVPEIVTWLPDRLMDGD